MGDPGLRVTIERNEDIGLIRLDGELDMATYEDVLTAIRASENAGITQWAVDCSDLTFLDSYGLRALLSLAGEAGGIGSIALYEPRPQVRQLLELAGLSEAFTIRDRPEDG